MLSPLGRLQHSCTDDYGAGNRDYTGFNFKSFKEKFLKTLVKNELTRQLIFTSVITAYFHAAKLKLKYNQPIAWVEKTPHNFLSSKKFTKFFQMQISI